MKEMEKKEEETDLIEAEETEATTSTKPLSGINRGITDIQKLINNEAAIQLVIGDLDRLEKEVIKLSQFQEKFHQVDKERAVLLEGNIKIKRLELLYNVCLAVGTALVALNPHVDSSLFWLGAVLLILSVISWLWQWWKK